MPAMVWPSPRVSAARATTVPRVKARTARLPTSVPRDTIVPREARQNWLVNQDHIKMNLLRYELGCEKDGVSRFPTRSDTNWPVQLQKMA